MHIWININKCSPLAEMTTKFNKDMYAQMRNKKDEPLPVIGAKSVRVMERGAPILAALPSTSTLGTVGTALSTLSMEEPLPGIRSQGTGISKRRRLTLDPSTSGMMPGLPSRVLRTSLVQMT